MLLGHEAPPGAGVALSALYPLPEVARQIVDPVRRHTPAVGAGRGLARAPGAVRAEDLPKVAGRGVEVVAEREVSASVTVAGRPELVLGAEPPADDAARPLSLGVCDGVPRSDTRATTGRGVGRSHRAQRGAGERFGRSRRRVTRLEAEHLDAVEPNGLGRLRAHGRGRGFGLGIGLGFRLGFRLGIRRRLELVRLRGVGHKGVLGCRDGFGHRRIRRCPAPRHGGVRRRRRVADPLPAAPASPGETVVTTEGGARLPRLAQTREHSPRRAARRVFFCASTGQKPGDAEGGEPTRQRNSIVTGAVRSVRPDASRASTVKVREPWPTRTDHRRTSPSIVQSTYWVSVGQP